MIRYGIVGIGGFGATWVRCLQALEQKGVARLAAAVVRNRPKYAAQVAALETQGCRIYARLEDMLADGRGALEVIGIPTGIGYHEPMAIETMEAGYNVHIEKPVAGTVQEVARLQEVERRTGRWCAVGYQWLHSPTVQWMRTRLTDGRLGAIQEMRCMIGWPRPASYYARNAWAGHLWDNGRWILDGPVTNAVAHYLTNMLYLLAAQQGANAALATMRAELYRAKPIATYDTACLEMHSIGGARLLFSTSHAVAHPLEPVMTVRCDRGTLDWTAQNDTAILHYADGREERFANPDPAYNAVRPFEYVARFAAGQEVALLSGLAEGGPHVLAVNLSFESSGDVWPVTIEYTENTVAQDGSDLMVIKGMEEALQQSYAHGQLFSDQGVPWGCATPSVSAAGYARFPQSEALGRRLGVNVPV
jgi:predicted dehydrogenase